MKPLPDPPATLCEAFQRTAAARPGEPALLTLAGPALTWGQYADRVASVAAALLHLGVRRGEPVALMLTNRPEFHVADCAALHLGAIPYSLYNSLPAEQIQHLLAETGAQVVVTERRFLPVLREARVGTAVRHLVAVDGPEPGAEDDGTVTLADAEAGTPGPFDLAAALAHLVPDDLVTLIHTSGTTGRPKAVEITHRAMLAQLAGTQEVLEVTSQDSHISFLPAAHIADRWGSHYTHLLCGTSLTCLDDMSRLPEALALVRPSLFGAVPAVWQRIRTALEGAIADADPQLRALAQDAMATGGRLSGGRWAGTLTPPERTELDNADVILAELRRRVGLDRARVCITGAAPAPEGLQEFFHGLGLPLTDAWGMSEVSGIALISPPGRPRPGTVGRPVPGAEIRIADDGELLVRAPFLMRGYRDEPELTARTVDAAGWLHTGDIAEVRADGDIRIVDRKKDLIINTGGKNMAPARIEGVLRESSPLLAHAVVIGDGRPFNVALLVPDRDAVIAWARRVGIASDTPWDTHSGQLAAALAEAVAVANTRLSRPERIRAHATITEEWTPGGPELTVTLKVRRAAVIGRYAELVETLYRPGGAVR